MGDTNTTRIQLTVHCVYLSLQEGKACEETLKETRELWQKSGNIQCEKDLKQVAQELTLTCQGQVAAKAPAKKPAPKNSRQPKQPKMRDEIENDPILAPNL